ncbi:fatty acid--CoA ligase [Methylobacter sp. BlB1]|uniref:fatty acid--CoA ligase n=1 Tax=Methylobacter sp. BlB1 TaxID=2785914 RepID=UPI001892F4A1|nr:fatty acid--CoA ligase [Methylobacter sp. BlB1]MBF6649329.1 fatty acid--CoA ligase [Methylobacter sp. BlB1]
MKSSEFQTLAEMCIQQAQARPDAVAFIAGSNRQTFQQLDLSSNQVGHGLIAAGVKPGSRVAIIGKDTIAHYEILFGCAKIKAVLVDLNWRLASPEILYILNDSETEVLFVAKEFFPLVQSLTSQLTTIRTIIALNEGYPDWPAYEDWKTAKPATPFDCEYSADDAAVQMYSSGTTGRPKGVQLANYSFFRLMQGMRAAGDTWMSLNPADTLLLALPQFHIGGLWWAIQGYAVGAAGVIVDTFVAWQALQLIERHQVTKAVLVPSMIQLMLEEPSCAQTDLSSFKGLLYGGSPIAPPLLRKAMEIFGCDFFQIYGLTETGNMAVCLRPDDHCPEGSPRMKAAGRPLPGVEIKIIDGQGRLLPAGRSGEICIKSPSNMLGYWKNESATAQTLVGGWVHTGDVGYRDEEGYVYVCDRIKDMIIYAGENLFPAEIEAVLSEHEAVAEVAVIGIPDEKWGEVVKAFVVPRQGGEIKQRELIDFARSRIADFKVPKSVTFVDALPRNPSGKVLKRVLRAPFWQDQDRQVS